MTNSPFDTEDQALAGVEDVDPRHECPGSNRRSAAWYAALVVLDVLAILAFVAWVVVPRLN